MDDEVSRGGQPALRRAELAAERVVERGRHLGPTGGAGELRGGDGHGVGHGRVALEIDELLGHAHTTDAIREGVVHPLDHRAPAVVEAVDEQELPERVRGVVGPVAERHGDVDHLIERTGGIDRAAPHVALEVEVRVVHPARWREATRPGLHPLS